MAILRHTIGRLKCGSTPTSAHELTETRRCSLAAKVEDETVEATAIWLQGLEDRIRDGLELVSTKARRNQDDPCVRRIRRNGLMSKLDEINDVRGDDRPSFSRCIGELRPVV